MNILQDQERQLFSATILRLVGYGFLIMAVLDILFLIVPPDLMNPTWEFYTIGSIIDKLPVAFLGIVLVYFGEKSDRAPIELLILKALSWLTLVMAIFSLLVIPLNISNSFRIYNQENAQVNTPLVEQKAVIQKVKEQIQAVNSKEQIETILQQQTKQQVSIPDAADLQKIKKELETNLQNNQDQLTKQIQSFKSQKRNSLLKQCLKWNLGALIASILFFLIWKSTGWARITTNFNDNL